MMVDGLTRIACTTPNCGGGPSEHTDWVLAANTDYVRADGITPIATTDANGLFPIPLTNTYSADVGTSEGTRLWTGYNIIWVKQNVCDNLGAPGTAWTALTGDGNHARFDAIDIEAINYSVQMCIDNNFIACVEQ